MMLLGGVCARTASADALVHWLPSSDPAIVGYNVYVRQAGASYAAPIKAGLSGRAADGTHTYRVGQALPASTTWYFAVSGYRADGTEGQLSNEIALGSTDPCVLDQCFTPSSCMVMVRADGSRCADDDAADPCSELCHSGTCGAAERVDLTTGRLSLSQATRGVRVGATAALPLEAATGIGTAGLALSVDVPGGLPVFETFVPGVAFKASANGSSFRYRAPRGTTTGLLRFSTRRSGTQVRLSMRAIAPGVLLQSVPSQIRWMVSVGAQCGSDLGLVCNRGSGSMTCS